MDAKTKKQIDELVADREKFNKFVYTPIDEAIRELETRRNNKELMKRVQGTFGKDVPESIQKGPIGVLFRQLATPNYETMRFLTITDAMDLTPVFFEYLDDKFTSNNDLKYFLGRIGFHRGFDKNKEVILEFKTILDFAKYDGKPIRQVKTLGGQALADLHHGLFPKTYKKYHEKLNFFDVSDWFKKNGKKHAEEYYQLVLNVFITNGILFENFMLDLKELSFTKQVFLPAFIEIIEKFGVKPLIVALEPTEIEGERFWYTYPEGSREWFK